MKISVKNPVIIGNSSFISERKKTQGIVTSLLSADSFFERSGIHELESSDHIEFVDVTRNDPIEVSKDDINSLNIIIHDCECSDAFIQQICQKLDENSIKHRFASHCQNIDEENSVVVTLDQQFISGPNMVILAPYDNYLSGNSDALALSCQAAFSQKGFHSDGIFCGKKGYKQIMESNTILTRIPTPTEEICCSKPNCSFVTICFGTENSDPNYVADTIVNALGRFSSYLKKNNTDDLIYRADEADTLSELSEKYHTSISKLNVASGMEYDNYILPLNQTVINPIVQNEREFDSMIPIEVLDKRKSSNK